MCTYRSSIPSAKKKVSLYGDPFCGIYDMRRDGGVAVKGMPQADCPLEKEEILGDSVLNGDGI